MPALRRWAERAAGTALLGAACVAALFFFNRAAAPPAKVLPVEGARDPDYAALVRHVEPRGLRADLEALCAAPSRFAGSEGCDRAAGAIGGALRAAGFEVVDQPFALTVPATRASALCDAAGAPLPGYSLAPLLPNWFRTCTVPPGGLRGTVRRAQKGLVRELGDADLASTIVLLPLGTPWTTLGAAGVRAFLYFDDGRPDPGARWDHHADASLAVPRFLVRGDAAALEGREVLIRARVDFEERTVRNVVGLLEAPGADELVVVAAAYDAHSYAPDVAPGAGPACAPAALLAAARHLAAERGAHRRSVAVLATAGRAQGLAGAREFVRALGACEARGEAVAAAEDELRRLDAALAGWPDGAVGFGTGSEAGAAVGRSALDRELMAAMERAVAARVDWAREGMPVRDAAGGGEAPAFAAYTAARAVEQHLLALGATPPAAARARWAAREPELFARLDAAAAAERDAGRAELARRRERAAARLTLARRLAPYRRVLALDLEVTAADVPLALACGDVERAANSRPGDVEVMAQLREAQLGWWAADPPPAARRVPVENLLRANDAKDLAYVPAYYGPTLYFAAQAFVWAGHPAFVLTTHPDARGSFGTPFDTLDRMLAADGAGATNALAALCGAARTAAGAASRLARGHGRLLPITARGDVHTIRGRVVSRTGDNLTPDHPMAGAIVRLGPLLDPARRPLLVPPGGGTDLCLTADRDGAFELPYVWGRALSLVHASPVDLDAAVLRAGDGAVTWALSEPDSGPGAPYAVRGVPIAQLDRLLAMPVLFRAAGVEVIPMPDPATLRPYTGFGFVDARTLAPPRLQKTESWGGSFVCFVPPETRLAFTFKKAAWNNPNLSAVRAFALHASGAPDGTGLEGQPELAGSGYFAADSPRVLNVELDAARSMAQVNARRLRLQQERGMADAMTLAYHRRAVSAADAAGRAASAGRLVEAKRRAAESLAYSSNIHPVIRRNASDAIVGILFYLLLAVPFAICVEKLLVGHPDIRFQVLGQGVVFLLFFLALRALHPAYGLVRSPAMILLGFLTLALAALVTAFVGGRFQGNVRALQQRVRQRAEAAEVSRSGAAAAAFVLGLGHLRKRRVRTALTAGTLVLMTFVLLSFTSVTSDVVDLEVAVGRAPYTGLCVRDRRFADVRASLGPLRELYGERHLVTPREWAGNFTIPPSRLVERREWRLQRKAGERTYDAVAHAYLGLGVREPRVTPVASAFEVLERWFESDTETSCFLPRPMADALHVADDDVRAGRATVSIGGKPYAVRGVFDPARMDAVVDLDGQSLLPLDILGLLGAGGGLAATAHADPAELPEDLARLPAATVVVFPCEAMPARTLTGSIAVAFQGLDYRGARALLTEHLERSAEPAYYGLDGVAWYGGKFRRRSLEGVLDVVLPLLLAAMTVLNTMRGSVYERRDEIWVFNSVGLSPVHVRSLFLAEASVYAVLGATGGYLLAQALGAALGAAGWTAGLSLNYSSLSAVFVSAIVMGVVLLSSLYPARLAARLAAPAESMVRARRTAEGDRMEFDLPFTFGRRDRVAVVPYFADWFDDYGEGSSGEFYCAPPACSVVADGEGAAPCVETTTWLKPYDLGVSQRVRLAVRAQPRTGDAVATVALTRLSGDVVSWERSGHAFIGLLRKRFLTWRGVAEEDRARLFERGRALLAAGGGGAGA